MQIRCKLMEDNADRLILYRFSGILIKSGRIKNETGQNV